MKVHVQEVSAPMISIGGALRYTTYTVELLAVDSSPGTGIRITSSMLQDAVQTRIDEILMAGAVPKTAFGQNASKTPRPAKSRVDPEVELIVKLEEIMDEEYQILDHEKIVADLKFIALGVLTLMRQEEQVFGRGHMFQFNKGNVSCLHCLTTWSARVFAEKIAEIQKQECGGI